MTRTAAGLETLPAPNPGRVHSVPAQPIVRPQAYDRYFWLTYVANFFMVAAVSVLFRYSDFVTSLGGRDYHLGWIVGAGMVGSLTMRLFQGAGIDRYGPRVVWVASLLGFIASCLAHPTLTAHNGVGIYAWRIVMQTCIAGVYGASIAYVSARAPIERLFEHRQDT